ncbi:toxin-antitoxin system HicB family antitoxin [Desulfospira joergensenii]|uniref:toxin-antitoxin system HicB family antitoxin n=1 Tax=Desulfospira joergensenii TaxID=53329 RepID=UPI0003B57B29|nr:toxin-antitoxin system HicB family antitoxin [Desulfospira joergensenii]
MVRVEPELHKALADKAGKKEKCLNAGMNDTLQDVVKGGIQADAWKAPVFVESCLGIPDN